MVVFVGVVVFPMVLVVAVDVVVGLVIILPMLLVVAVVGVDVVVSTVTAVVVFLGRQSAMSDDDWDKAMVAYRKLLPASTQVVMVGSDRPLPKRLTVRYTSWYDCDCHGGGGGGV